jgi:HPt (histidine-containing phosphotransfer) domain-containing protein
MEVPNEIMNKYIERRKRDLQACLSFVENQQYQEIEKIAHQLKGNGFTFGYPELSNIGKKLELAAQEHDLEILQDSLREFSLWVNRLH